MALQLLQKIFASLECDLEQKKQAESVMELFLLAIFVDNRASIDEQDFLFKKLHNMNLVDRSIYEAYYGKVVSSVRDTIRSSEATVERLKHIKSVLGSGPLCMQALDGINEIVGTDGDYSDDERAFHLNLKKIFASS